MGRKKGESSRSNSRASSSSQAASLLQTSATPSIGFGGFVGSARFDVAPSSDGEHLLDVDGDAFLHLKRLSKKDQTTKLKALAALADLFKEHPPADLSTLLIPWVFEYRRLVQDNSRQVRQSTHVAMSGLATSVGRGLAPHLRSFMGPWWVAQFDPAREVSEAAKASFQVAFSGQKKRLEALVFCEKEIFIHLNDNLKLTPQTISDKATPIEESTEKYERVLSCSLLAVAAFIDVLVGSVSSSSDQDTATTIDGGEATAKIRSSISEEAAQLCYNHKFMRLFLKAKSSCIRSGTYQALRSFIQHLPQVFREEDMEVVVPLILGTFAETDSACHQPMWDMVLLFARGFPQAWGFKVVKTAVFPQLLGFLRHGCYGSQQISYPYLLVLISLIPPEAIFPVQNFLLEFFRSLWQGRLVPQGGTADGVALLKAVQDCLIWTVLNAKRFCEAEGCEAFHLQVTLINGVLIKLMWLEYVGTHPQHKTPLASSAVDSTSSSDLIGLISFNKPIASANQFAQELGFCIVQAIRILSGHGDEIMDVFWDEFQSFCFQTVQEAGDHWQPEMQEDLRMSRIADFFTLLGRKSPNGENREQWSLTHAVRPFVAKSFPAIRSLGHPAFIRLIARLTSIHGPTVFSLLSLAKYSESLKDQNHEGSQVQDLESDNDLLQYFKKDVVPWCLDGNGTLIDSKAEVVLAFLENSRFQGEWEFVIAQITGWQDDSEDRVDVQQVGILATLLEKVRERKDSSPSYKEKNNTSKEKDSGSDQWKLSSIDGATLTVASSKHLSHPDCVRLLRSALGGTSSEPAFRPLVSDKAAMQTLEKLLMKMLRVLSASTTKWIRSAPTVIMGLGVSDPFNHMELQEITEDDLLLAASAIDVVRDCMFSLLSLDNHHTVGGKLLGAIFCLNWTCSGVDTSAVGDRFDSTEEYDTDSTSSEEIGLHDIDSPHEVSTGLNVREDIEATSETLKDEQSHELALGWGLLQESLRSVLHKLSPLFCGSFSALTRFRVRAVLINCLRLGVLDEQFESPQQMAVKCAAWSKGVASYFCEGSDELSEFVDLLIASEDPWPRWVESPSPMDKQHGRNAPTWKAKGEFTHTQRQRHDRFATFVDQLCRTLGPQEVLQGSGVLLGTEVEREDDLAEELCKGGRIWLIVELLCTWEWSGGGALRHVLPFLCTFARSPKGSSGYTILWGTIQVLFLGSLNFSPSTMKALVPTSTNWEDNCMISEEPCLRALLVLLKSLLEKEDGWSKFDARDLFRQYVIRPEAVDLLSPICDVQILPHVLSVLMPLLRKQGLESPSGEGDEEWQSFLQTAVSVWLKMAMKGPPLVAYNVSTEISGSQWTRVALACFPLNSAGGAAAMASASSALVTSQERELLLAFLRKQFSREAIASVAAFAAVDRMSSEKVPAKVKRNQAMEVTLAKLVAAAVGYCWLDFGTEEWEFILKRLRGWLQDTVIEVEEFTEAIVDVFKEFPENAESKDSLSVVKDLENVLTEKRSFSVEVSSIAVTIFSLLRGLYSLEGIDSTDVLTNMKAANWEILEMRVLEDVLRILLATGLAESSAGKDGGNVIELHRKSQDQLWDSVADVALGASSQAREAAIRAVDLWGVGKGAISSLYALLFSSQPTISLQWTAYHFLSTGQILHMAITCGIDLSGEMKFKVDDEGEAQVEEVKRGDAQDIPPALVARIRPELSSILETNPTAILSSPLTSTLRVSYFLGWSLLLTRLQSPTALSRTRESIVQYIQDSNISPTLLDCLFQHIPLEQNFGTSASRRGSRVAGVKLSSAAAAAVRAATLGSVVFAVEGLWPIQKDGLVTLCGALYGLMLLLLPAFVRTWFTGLRNKLLSSAIEAFTTTHCSPQRLAAEFAQVQASVVDEENLSIRANRSLREVTAIYEKEEVGIDIVIRIPSCYPLRTVDVECTRRMGINETLNRKWILSMAAFVWNQNGSVAEAVQMWKRNVDREFEGVEACPICYSIIHTSNHNVPRLACKTCRHKFHSACLYKWFFTSHQSTCPLCKSPF